MKNSKANFATRSNIYMMMIVITVKKIIKVRIEERYKIGYEFCFPHYSFKSKVNSNEEYTYEL